MGLGSLVGFGIVFLATSFVLSGLLALPVLALGTRLRRLGPWVERRAVAGALGLPPVLAFGLVAVLVASSLLALRSGTDHCLDHGHHLHLCVLHGAPWVSQAWALALVAFALTFVVVRACLSGWAHFGAQRSVGRLRKLGTRLGARRTYLVPSNERFAFTAGLFSPAVIVSSAAWNALDAEQRAAILVHERAHIENGDLWLRVVLGIAATLGFPGVASRLLATWSLTAERICDRQAANEVGRPSTVASAMLALAGTSPAPVGPAGVVFAAASCVPERIVAVLEEGPGGEARSKLMLATLALAAASAVLAWVAFAEPIHHVLETLLG
jgi:Zn-dependent protease with chaperone function